MNKLLISGMILVVVLLGVACGAPSSPFPAPTVTETLDLEAIVRATMTAMAAQSAAVKGSCPFYVYEAWGSDKNHYVPKGWMGDYSDIKFDDNYKLDPERPSVIQIVYTPTGADQFAGIFWWDPPEAFFADIDGGFDLSCATKLTFWARGEYGGEKAEFKVGGLSEKYQDSLQPAFSTGPIVLTDKWENYTLNLRDKDLSHIIGGFVWVTNKPSNPAGATIYLDDIRFEE